MHWLATLVLMTGAQVLRPAKSAGLRMTSLVEKAALGRTGRVGALGSRPSKSATGGADDIESVPANSRVSFKRRAGEEVRGLALQD
jgi:hypothetical protein